MTKNIFISLTLLAATSIPFFAAAADVTMHEVYEAAQAGRLTQAQAMIEQVLRDHPNSGKAHFVEAELLAKQGLREQARAELTTARRLNPGLSFAKPQAVEELNRVLNGVPAASRGSPASALQAGTAGISWGLILLLALGLGMIVATVRALRPRQPLPAYTNASGGYGAPVPPPAYGTASGNGPGLLGSLASGVAVGAGVVAGEELVRHLIHRDDRGSDTTQVLQNNDSASSDTMGGQDFGMADSASWDDSSSGDSSGGDWG